MPTLTPPPRVFFSDRKVFLAFGLWDKQSNSCSQISAEGRALSGRPPASHTDSPPHSRLFPGKDNLTDSAARLSFSGPRRQVHAGPLPTLQHVDTFGWRKKGAFVCETQVNIGQQVCLHTAHGHSKVNSFYQDRVCVSLWNLGGDAGRLKQLCSSTPFSSIGQQHNQTSKKTVPVTDNSKKTNNLKNNNNNTTTEPSESCRVKVQIFPGKKYYNGEIIM